MRGTADQNSDVVTLAWAHFDSTLTTTPVQPMNAATPTRTEYVAIAASLPLTKNKSAQVQWVRERRYYPDDRAFASLPRPVSAASDAEIAAAFAASEYDKGMRSAGARLECEAE